MKLGANSLLGLPTITHKVSVRLVHDVDVWLRRRGRKAQEQVSLHTCRTREPGLPAFIFRENGEQLRIGWTVRVVAIITHNPHRETRLS